MRNPFEIFRCGARVIVLFAIYSIGISEAAAQEERDYVPFVEEGKVWYCAAYDYPYDSDDIYPSTPEDHPCTPEDPDGEGIDCIFTMCGDTLINDLEYKKVYCQFEEYYGDGEQHYYCAVREEARQVFIIEEEAKEEKLIYDFSRPWETITITYNDYEFARTDGWRYYNFPPDQWIYVVGKFTEEGEVDYSHDSGWWMDGVGSILNNPFALELDFLPLDEPKFGKVIIVVTCMRDGKYYFRPEWLAGPGEQTSIGDMTHIDSTHKGVQFYDLTGRRLISTSKRGIYIQNGKKFISK